jgi:hypothetical protein
VVPRRRINLNGANVNMAKQIKFVTGMPPFVVGDVAIFSDDDADFIVSSRRAMYWTDKQDEEERERKEAEKNDE